MWPLRPVDVQALLSRLVENSQKYPFIHYSHSYRSQMLIWYSLYYNKSCCTLMCFVMSTLQGRMLQSLLSLTIWHFLLLLVMRKDTPRPQVFEQGLHEVVWVTQFLFQLSFTLDRAVGMQRKQWMLYHLWDLKNYLCATVQVCCQEDFFFSFHSARMD